MGLLGVQGQLVMGLLGVQGQLVMAAEVSTHTLLLVYLA